MLYTVAVVLIVLWLLGIVTSYTLGGFIHALLVIAVLFLFPSTLHQIGHRRTSRSPPFVASQIPGADRALHQLDGGVAGRGVHAGGRVAVHGPALGTTHDRRMGGWRLHHSSLKPRGIT